MEDEKELSLETPYTKVAYLFTVFFWKMVSENYLCRHMDIRVLLVPAKSS